jgi:hypothetical protein
VVHSVESEKKYITQIASIKHEINNKGHVHSLHVYGYIIKISDRRIQQLIDLILTR